MELSFYKERYVELIKKLGYSAKKDEIKGIDCFFPCLERIKKDSAVIIIKLDGEREDNVYTFLVSGKKLGSSESIRMDTSDLEGGLAYICTEYARIAWKIV